MRRALLLGRFQPFHLGHMAAVEAILADFDEAIIAIGSAYASHSAENPLTAGERIELIRASLPKLNDRCEIIPLADMHRNAIWVSHVLSMVPKFEVIYSNNGLVRTLFSESGIEVREITMLRRGEVSGTRIRERLQEGKDLEGRVRTAAAELLEQWQIGERLRQVARSDQ